MVKSRVRDQIRRKEYYQCIQQEIRWCCMLSVVQSLKFMSTDETLNFGPHIKTGFAYFSMQIIDGNWSEDSRAITRPIFRVNSKLLSAFRSYMMFILEFVLSNTTWRSLAWVFRSLSQDNSNRQKVFTWHEWRVMNQQWDSKSSLRHCFVSFIDVQYSDVCT